IKEICQIHGTSENSTSNEPAPEASVDNGVFMQKNSIFYGPPGTGKTYSLVKEVLDITECDLPKNSNIHAIIRHGANNNKFKQVEFITFHQSYSYEEFVEGIRAEVVNGQVTYKIHNGIFKRLCRRAYFYKVMSLVGEDDKQYFTDDALSIYENKKANELNKNLLNILTEHATKETPEDSKKDIPKFVLCIDEINRANISRVFGELITLIEDTKRQGAKETISVTLPYSGDEFFVPDNLYIRGTMNTADRSLAKLDLALRRRFHFEAYYPDLDQVKNATARNILDQLNSFITRELDREHTIGHSYLMTIDEDATGDTLNKALAEAFKGKIIPLLEEYFLHEPAKVNEAITAAGIANDVVNI
ncbi:McrB family protein, partial [Rheinheimera sp.]